MIHGHTHRPAVHDFMLDGKPARRIVLGDWFEQGSVLSCSPQGQRLRESPSPSDASPLEDKGCPYDNSCPLPWAGCNAEPCIYSVSVHTHEDEMMGFLTWVVLGLIVGILAKWIMPGKDGGGFFMTVILGVVGAMVGGYVGTLLGMGTVTGFNLPSILIATVGALIVLFVYNRSAAQSLSPFLQHLCVCPRARIRNLRVSDFLWAQPPLAQAPRSRASRQPRRRGSGARR